MKDQLPLTDRDFAVVRKSVMTAIEARQARHVRTVRTVQLVFAVLVVTVGAWWLIRPASTPLTTPTGPRAQQTAGSQNNTATPEIAQQPAPSTSVATNEGHPRRTNRIAAGRRHHTPAHEIASITEPIRLELKTDDPDIRIIWITNPTNPTNSR